MINSGIAIDEAFGKIYLRNMISAIGDYPAIIIRDYAKYSFKSVRTLCAGGEPGSRTAFEFPARTNVTPATDTHRNGRADRQAINKHVAK